MDNIQAADVLLTYCFAGKHQVIIVAKGLRKDEIHIESSHSSVLLASMQCQDTMSWVGTGAVVSVWAEFLALNSSTSSCTSQ